MRREIKEAIAEIPYEREVLETKYPQVQSVS